MEDKIAYLEQFYTIEEIKEYTQFNSEAISLLYEKTQPKQVPIRNLKDVLTHNKYYLTDSPDGWVKVSDWVEKQKKYVYEVTFSNGKVVKASYDHLFQKNDLSWIYTENLNIGDSIISFNGVTTVISKHFIGEHKVYDLSVDHDNHRYYTNGICSHNTGKSLFLQNIALNWVEKGKDVIYITLELSEELTGMRMNAMISGKKTRDVFRDTEDIGLSIKTMHKVKKWGNLIVKFMPIGTTANDLKAYLKEYEIQKGKKPDCLVVDYLDLLHPNNRRVNPSDLFVKDKYVSEELRSLLQEGQLLGATASQLNRAAMEEQNHEMYHIAGGVSKINTADNVMTIYTSQTLKDQGAIQLQFIKTRSSSGVGHRIFLAFNQDSLRISDGEEEDEDAVTKDISELGQRFKRKSQLEAAKEASEESNGNAARQAKTSPKKSNTAEDTVARGAALRNMLKKVNDD